MKQMTIPFRRSLLIALIVFASLSVSITEVNASSSLRKGIKGAAAGALIGAAIGGGDGAAKGAMIGGGVGIIAGANDRDRHIKHKRHKKKNKKRRNQRDRAEHYRRR